MKMMHGALAPAWAKRSRTRAAPTPTNISTNSEPDREKNGTPASPATARARSVLPVPGGPTRSTPLGMRPPSFRNFSGVRRKSTISRSSSTASSIPATSSNPTPVSASACTRARVLPKLMTLCGPCPSPPALIRRIIQVQKTKPSSSGSPQIQAASPRPLEGIASYSIFFCSRSRVSSGSSTRLASQGAVWGSAVRDGRPGRVGG